jgi:hypothetical protein
MSFMLTFVARRGAADRPISEGADIEGLDLRVGGIDSSNPSDEHTVEWVEDTGLRLGDDIRIRIVTADALDPPGRREPIGATGAGAAVGLRFEPCPTCGVPRITAPVRD